MVDVLQEGIVTVCIPTVVNFQRAVAPVPTPRTPEDCDHAGQSWSGELGVKCACCNVRLFAAPAVLANLPAAVIDLMHQMWQDAGRPWLAKSWYGRRVAYGNWTIVDHPLFGDGLPVNNDRLAAFALKHLGSAQ